MPPTHFFCWRINVVGIREARKRSRTYLKPSCRGRAAPPWTLAPPPYNSAPDYRQQNANTRSLWSPVFHPTLFLGFYSLSSRRGTHLRRRRDLNHRKGLNLLVPRSSGPNVGDGGRESLLIFWRAEVKVQKWPTKGLPSVKFFKNNILRMRSQFLIGSV